MKKRYTYTDFANDVKNELVRLQAEQNINKAKAQPIAKLNVINKRIAEARTKS